MPKLRRRQGPTEILYGCPHSNGLIALDDIGKRTFFRGMPLLSALGRLLLHLRAFFNGNRWPRPVDPHFRATMRKRCLQRLDGASANAKAICVATEAVRDGRASWIPAADEPPVPDIEERLVVYPSRFFV
jgi:hypothetical protein